MIIRVTHAPAAVARLGRCFLVFLSVVVSVLTACSDPQLTSLALTPQAPSLAKGTTTRLVAMGKYDDGSTKDLTSSVTWATDAASTATVARDAGKVGLVSALAPGRALITAVSGEIRSSATVTVTDATLAALQLNPPSAIVPLGLNRSFTVVGTFSDGTTQDVTAQATLESATPALLRVDSSDAAKVATALAVGDARVSAALQGKSVTAPVLVSDAVLTQIDVSPKGAQLAKGSAGRFVATGVFSDGSTQDLSSRVTWGGSGVTPVAGSYGLLSATTPGAATVSATFGDLRGAAALTVSSATLTALSVSPGVGSLAKGTTQQLSATGSFSDGTTQDLTASVAWTSEADAVATVSAAGLASAHSRGSAVVRATSGSGAAAISGVATVVVRAAEVVTLAIAPQSASLAKGTAQQFAVTATFTDGTTQDVTSQAACSGSGLSFSPTEFGLAVVGSVGATTALCSFGGKSSEASVVVTDAVLRSIAVTPSPVVLAKGTARTLVATGTYSDGTTQDLSATVSWSSDAADVATVADGRVSAVSHGAAAVRAVQGAGASAVSGAAPVVVSDAELVRLTVAPQTASVAKGDGEQFTVTAEFSDNSTQDITDQASWAAVSGSVASVAAGLATGVASGTSAVRASFRGQSAEASLTVGSAEGRAVAMEASALGLERGKTVEPVATLTYSDGATSRVRGDGTWSSADTAVATVDGQGVVTGVAPGSALITVTVGAHSASTTMVVVDVPTGMTLSPATSSLLVDDTVLLVATATYADGTTRDLAARATFSSSDSAVATVSNAAGSQGLVNAVASGTATITARYGDLSATATVTVRFVPGKKVWRTAGNLNGNFGGPVAADALCMSELPMGVVSAKAAIANGTTRVACTSSLCVTGGVAEHVDWVFKADQPYTDTAGTRLFVTDSVRSIRNSVNTMMTGGIIWSGLQWDGTTGLTCMGWSVTTFPPTANAGFNTNPGSMILSAGTTACSSSIPVLCVEQ